MLKRIKKLLTPGSSGRAPIAVQASDHKILKSDISSGALRVIDELQKAKHEAYLVGGGVRDLLLGGHPKDFDVATSATPEQVQEVFRRARIIGRRFKIVHVRMGREIIEVTTFRGSHEEGHRHAQTSDKGVLLRDNVYGSLESDAFRRDFSINALYYNPRTEEIIDFTGAMPDLANKRLRIIGDPQSRYKEDPVRMLRAVRFACKLGFKLSPESEAPIREHSEYMAEVPAARLFEEVLKLFMSGHAEQILDSLNEYHLLQYLFPITEPYLQEDSAWQKLIRIATRNTDERIQSGKRVTPAFLFAAYLWPALQKRIKELCTENKVSAQEALYLGADAVVQRQQAATSIQRRFQGPMREIWLLQQRLTRRDKKRALSMLEHPRFRAAYDFLLIREEAGELNDGLGAWWTNFQQADREQQDGMLKELAPQRKRRRRRTKPSNDQD